VGLVERIAEQRRPRNAFSVGAGAVESWDRRDGHDQSAFAPEEYGNYLATSNEVFSAAMLRARLMGGLDLRLYDRDGPERVEILDGPEHALLRHVNPFWNRRRLNVMDELSMCLWGESFWAIERDAGGTPREIWWLKPSRVRPVPHPVDYLAGYLYAPANGGKSIPFRADEVVWFRFPNPLDEFSPLSPLGAARLAADTASAMMISNRNLFTQGLQLGGLVVPATDKVSFTKPQAEDLEETLARRFVGSDKAHRWAVLRYEAKFQPLNVSPKDAEFVNGLNLTLRQVGNAYGIPVTLLNDMANATLTNAREHERLLWTNALQPESALKSEEIVEQFLPMFGRKRKAGWAEFDYGKIAPLQDAASEIWSRERQAIEVGALTINEWRKSKGLPPVEWGDVYWVPVNKAPVENADGAQGDVQPAVPKPAAMPANFTKPADFIPATARDEFLAAISSNGHH